ncbi:MAG: cytochrome P450 [Parachlamydiaceae bacterium]|nr:cytochrome P450 [Parachlamydiaceae bacterium]
MHTDFGSYSYFIDHYHRLRDCNLVGKYPNEFNPERFLHNGDLIHDVKKTFGGGLTPCLGKHFAITETLLLIASNILQGTFELIEGDPIEVIREAGAHLSSSLKIRIHLKDD